jgi:hypothetical protein
MMLKTIDEPKTRRHARRIADALSRAGSLIDDLFQRPGPQVVSDQIAYWAFTGDRITAGRLARKLDHFDHLHAQVTSEL